MTPAEHHVARLAAAGLTNRQIARARGTSTNTVANQMASLLRELGLSSRRALASLDAVSPEVEGCSAEAWATIRGRDRLVVERACRGEAQKVIAIDLGVAPATISRVIRGARLRLGLRTFAEMAAALRASLTPHTSP